MDEATTATTAESPRSPSNINAAAPAGDQQEQHYQPYQQRSAGTASAATEDSGAPCEMRRTPPQNKGETELHNYQTLGAVLQTFSFKKIILPKRGKYIALPGFSSNFVVKILWNCKYLSKKKIHRVGKSGHQ